MSNRKETAAAVESVATEETMPKLKTAARGPVMYVGPTIPGIGIQNQVFTEIPENIQEVLKADPEIGNLFIPIRNYPEANTMLREKKGYIYSAFNRALNLKTGGKK